MTHKQAYGILGVLEQLEINDYNMINKVVVCLQLQNNGKRVLATEWRDSFKNNNRDLYPLDLLNRDTWTTYDRCINFKFTQNLKEKQINCNVTLYEGSLLDGSRTQIKWQAAILLPKNFIINLKHAISNRMDRLAEETYELHLENQRNLYKNDFINELLKLNS